MVVWLNVAEKPSVAKEMANVLSGGNCRTQQSLSRFNPVFEFTFRGNTMLVTSVAGHLIDNDFGPSTKSWNTFPFSGLFTTPIVRSVRKDLEPVQRNLEQLARKAQVLVLWLDCDREGENICFEVAEVATRVNARLQLKRAHFSALTPRDLYRAMDTLGEPDQKLSEAVEARKELDLRVGAVFTRFQTVKFRDAFAEVKGVLSFGPCQFPTLGFVVRRRWEQQAFVVEEFFTFAMTHEHASFRCSRGSVYDQTAATLLFDGMTSLAAAEGGTARVLSAQQRPTRRGPPVPLATVVLQKLAASHLRISSERCMAVAEALYQEGFISYPRTETDSFNLQDSELLDLVRGLTQAPAVSAFAQAMCDDQANRFRRPKRGGHDDKAHPPIHPTKPYTGSEDDERGKLYLLIARHFLACLSPDAVAATTSVTASYGNELFTTTGTTIISRGWLDIFPYERWNDSSHIPHYTAGDTFVPTSVTLQRSQTSPPPDLTETDLIALMDDNGIGTDATIAQHIKTVVDRDYVRREGGHLVSTRLGVALAAAYEVLGLSTLLQPQLRAQMELAMSDIAAGKASREQVVAAGVRLYREIFDKLAAHAQTFHRELAKHLTAAAAPAAAELTVLNSHFIPCGRCGAVMALVRRREGERDTTLARCEPCGLLCRLPGAHATELAPTDPLQRCPLCSFYAIQVTNTEKRTAHTVCTHCFASPPAGACGDLEAVGNFRCFQCTADCPLAKGTEAIAITPCVSCRQSDLRLRTTPTGVCLACRAYPACEFTVFLPKAASVRPTEERCPHCAAVMLAFDFRGLQGLPGVDQCETLCVSCDARLRDYLTIRGLQSGNQRPTATATATAAPAGWTLPVVTGGRRGRGAGAGAGAQCQCGKPAKKLVSRKETSMGKEFYTCADRKCSFFQWVD